MLKQKGYFWDCSPDEWKRTTGCPQEQWAIIPRCHVTEDGMYLLFACIQWWVEEDGGLSPEHEDAEARQGFEPLVTQLLEDRSVLRPAVLASSR